MFPEKIAAFFVLTFLTSCISYVYPKGKWVEPVDLSLNNASLSGVPVKVECADASGGNLSEGEACVFIKTIIANMAADVEGLPEKDDSESQPATPVAKHEPLPPEILVTYQEVDSTFGLCGWSLYPFIVSGSLFPCRADATSLAKLTVTTLKNQHSQSWPLEVYHRKYFGIGALFLMLSEIGKPLSRSAYRTQQSENFVKFVENKVYTANTLQGGAL
jgi:hypothetical protein